MPDYRPSDASDASLDRARSGFVARSYELLSCIITAQFMTELRARKIEQCMPRGQVRILVLDPLAMIIPSHSPARPVCLQRECNGDVTLRATSPFTGT